MGQLQRQGRRHHRGELRKHSPAAAGRLSGQRNTVGSTFS
jgi:hypothetical protein